MDGSSGVNTTAIYGYARQYRVRPNLIRLIVGVLLAVGLLHSAVVRPYNSSSSFPSVAFSNRHAVTGGTSSQKPATTNSAAPAGAPVTKTAATPPQLINCQPDSYSGPAAINLATSSSGLTQVVDPIHYYQIYGYTVTQARQQISQCAPRLSSNGEDFTGYTSYRLSWSYDYGSNGAGQCVLSNVKLGMRIGEVLPALQPSNYADTTFTAKWSNFVAALNTHEQGHVALDEQYAAKIMGELQNFQPADCAGIDQTATNLIRSEVVALDHANDTYDTQTSHGATQGAVLP